MEEERRVVRPFRDLFNEINDIAHPLRCVTSLTFDLATPINNMFGFLHKIVLPANKSMPKDAPTYPHREYEFGSYALSRSQSGTTRSRLLVTATSSSSGVSTAFADFKHGESLLARGVLFVNSADAAEAGASMDWLGEDYAITAKAASTGSIYGAYHQRLGAAEPFSRISAGAEVMVSDLFPNLFSGPSVFPLAAKGPSSSPGLSYAAAASYTSADGDDQYLASLQQVRMGLPKLEMYYGHRSSKHSLAVAAVEYDSISTKSKTTMGFRTTFPRTRSIFTGSVASDGGLRASFERRLLSNVKGTITIDTNLWPAADKAQEAAVGVKVQIGAEPPAHLELTPLLMRDGPRSWQK